MSTPVIEISAISNHALEIMKRVIDQNEQTNKIENPELGPIPLASAMSDFFELAAGIEEQNQQPDEASMTEVAHYALDLLDRLASQIWHLDIHDQRDNMALLFVSVAVWLARHGSRLENLGATADSFAILVNAENDAEALETYSRYIDDVLEAATENLKQDQDKSDPWRPWRVLNLNSGVASTRSLNTELMQEIFSKMEKRLPYDLAGFFSDGKKQMDAQDVPEEVREVMTKFAKKWPFIPTN